MWKDNNNANKFAPATAQLYRSAFTLRQRMMSAVQNIEYYMMIEVIEPTWHEFVRKLGDVSNVDAVLLAHQDFLDDCLYNCMLKTPELLRAVTKLCNICLAFCKFIQVRGGWCWCWLSFKRFQYQIDQSIYPLFRIFSCAALFPSLSLCVCVCVCVCVEWYGLCSW